jgi:regulator of sigma E protease
MVKLVWVTLIQLISGRYGVKDLAGPVGTTVAIGQAATQGMSSLFYIVAMIAVNLGVVNLLPIPALDGGRLLFVFLEAIRRKPMKPQYEGYVHLAGFALFILLTLVVTFNDIIRIFK